MMESTIERYATPRVNILESDEVVLIEAELPGVEKGAADVEMKDGQLILKAARSVSGNDSVVKLRERPDAGYYRVFKLGDSIDAEHVEASMVDGVLTVTLPKVAQKNKHRSVEITDT